MIQTTQLAFEEKRFLNGWFKRGNKMYDYLVVGSGLFGAVFARQATDEGEFESNCVLAGTPARTIRRNVTWDRSNSKNFLFDETY